MGNFVFKFIICMGLLCSTPAYSSQCKPLFVKAPIVNTKKIISVTKGVVFFTTGTGIILGGLELSKNLEQNQAIFAGIVVGAIAFSMFHTLTSPLLMPIQNKIQRMAFRMLHNAELPTTVKHKDLHDIWRDNNINFGPNESMGRNHYMAPVGKAFHRMTYIREQLKEGEYEYATVLLKDLLTELKLYPEIFPHHKEFQGFQQTHITYLDSEIKIQARKVIEQMAERDPEFEEVSKWAKDYLGL